MATKFNINIIRGSRYLKSWIYQESDKDPIDLTGLEARMAIRRKDTSNTPEITLTTSGGEIVLGATAGQVDIVLGATVTDTISIDSGVYDLEIYDPLDLDIVDTILEGSVTVRDAVTR